MKKVIFLSINIRLVSFFYHLKPEPRYFLTARAKYIFVNLKLFSNDKNLNIYNHIYIIKYI
jgi:hypothetical protein